MSEPIVTDLDTKILGLATEITNTALEDDKGTIAVRAIVLIQYVGPDGKIYDSYFHAGEPRFTEVFGMLESHRLRVAGWFEDSMIEREESDDD